MVSFFTVDLMSRTSASADTNSVYTIAAPNRLHSMRKPMSVTSSIGARNTGRSPSSIVPIFIFQLSIINFQFNKWYVPPAMGRTMPFISN